MTTTTRPTVARKHTRTTKAKQDAELDETIVAVIDGVTYKLTPADLTGVHEMRIRKETGLSVGEILHGLQSSPGIDRLGMFMWVCDISQGLDSDLMDVLGSISYASEVDVVEGEPDPPEA